MMNDLVTIKKMLQKLWCNLDIEKLYLVICFSNMEKCYMTDIAILHRTWLSKDNWVQQIGQGKSKVISLRSICLPNNTIHQSPTNQMWIGNNWQWQFIKELLKAMPNTLHLGLWRIYERLQINILGNNFFIKLWYIIRKYNDA